MVNTQIWLVQPVWLSKVWLDGCCFFFFFHTATVVAISCYWKMFCWNTAFCKALFVETVLLKHSGFIQSHWNCSLRHYKIKYVFFFFFSFCFHNGIMLTTLHKVWFPLILNNSCLSAHIGSNIQSIVKSNPSAQNGTRPELAVREHAIP